MKSIALIGSTGSIGQKTLEIVRTRSDRFRVAALAARKNVELLIQQAKEFRPVGEANWGCCIALTTAVLRPEKLISNDLLCIIGRGRTGFLGRRVTSAAALAMAGPPG